VGGATVFPIPSPTADLSQSDASARGIEFSGRLNLRFQSLNRPAGRRRDLFFRLRQPRQGVNRAAPGSFVRRLADDEFSRTGSPRGKIPVGLSGCFTHWACDGELRREIISQIPYFSSRRDIRRPPVVAPRL
jgi:hypothetical protein